MPEPLMLYLILTTADMIVIVGETNEELPQAVSGGAGFQASFSRLPPPEKSLVVPSDYCSATSHGPCLLNLPVPSQSYNTCHLLNTSPCPGLQYTLDCLSVCVSRCSLVSPRLNPEPSSCSPWDHQMGCPPPSHSHSPHYDLNSGP